LVLTHADAIRLSSEARAEGDRETARKYSRIARDLQSRSSRGETKVNFYDNQTGRIRHSEAGSSTYVNYMLGTSERYVPVSETQVKEIREFHREQAETRDLIVPSQRVVQDGRIISRTEPGSEPGTAIITVPSETQQWTVTYDAGFGERKKTFDTEEEATTFMSSLERSGQEAIETRGRRETLVDQVGGWSQNVVERTGAVNEHTGDFNTRLTERIGFGTPPERDPPLTESQIAFGVTGIPGPAAGPRPGSFGEKLKHMFGDPATKKVKGAFETIEGPFRKITVPTRELSGKLYAESLDVPGYEGLAKWGAAIGLNIIAGSIDVATIEYRPGLILETVESVEKLAFTPGALAEVGKTIAADPVKIIFETVGSAALGTRFTSLLKTHVPTVKRGKIEIPLSEGRTIRWKGFYLDYGKRTTRLTGGLTLHEASGELIGASDDQLKILSSMGGSRGFVPQTYIETQITIDAMKKLDYRPSELQKVQDVRKILSATQKTSSQYIDDFLPTETGTLSADGVAAFKKFALENADDVERMYGSFAAKSQLNTAYDFSLIDDPVVSALRKPGDIDVVLTGSMEEATDFIKRLSEKLTSAGETVRIDPESPLMIQSWVGDRTWAHAIDGHLSGAPTIDAIFPQQWGFMVEQKPIKIEGLPVQALSEQSVRKGTAILGFADEATLGPSAWRSKDIVDFVQVAQTLEDSRPFWTRSVQFNIDSVKKLYGVTGIPTLKSVPESLAKTEFIFRSKVSPSVAGAAPLSVSMNRIMAYSPSYKTPSSASPTSLVPSSSQIIAYNPIKVSPTKKPSVSVSPKPSRGPPTVSSIVSYKPIKAPPRKSPTFVGKKSGDRKSPTIKKTASPGSVISYSPKPPKSPPYKPPKSPYAYSPPSPYPSPPSPSPYYKPPPPPPRTPKMRQILDFDPRKNKKDKEKSGILQAIERRKTPLGVINFDPRKKRRKR